jgi:RNA-binding protein PNO1
MAMEMDASSDPSSDDSTPTEPLGTADTVMLSSADPEYDVPSFGRVANHAARLGPDGKPSSEYRRIRCPAHRYTPLRNSWEQILTPLVQYLQLQVRFNTTTRSVELKAVPPAPGSVPPPGTLPFDAGSIQKGADFVTAFMLGFDVADCAALLRLDDLYLESFTVLDVKTLKGDHLSRAIGRLAGQDGKTRFAIENATRTRIVVAEQRIHILGSYANIRVARDAICGLILGAPPGKVYNSMRNVAKRMNER